MVGAEPSCVSDRAKERQQREMGTLGSGNHYLEVQAISEVFHEEAAGCFGLEPDEVVVTIHCGSRGLGHQIGTEFLREMLPAAAAAGISLPDRELACAPIKANVGQRYLGAMRAAINCALANREIIGHYARRVFSHFFPMPISICCSMYPTTPARLNPTRPMVATAANFSCIEKVRREHSVQTIPTCRRPCARLVSPFSSAVAWEPGLTCSQAA